VRGGPGGNAALFTTKARSRYLDARLHTKYFTGGLDLGSFAANYDTATAS
jgi:hypothetical protein